MKVEIIGARKANKRDAERVKKLSRKRIMNRQDSIDGVDMNVGPNRGVEAFFQ